MALALSQVVELATVIAGPSAAAVLADFGAEVTKVEAPGGDMCAPNPSPPPPPRRDASARRQCAAEGSCCERRWRVYGSQFGNENRGKKSVELDIKDPEQLAVLRAMIADSDIFLTNVRPAPLQRATLDYETLHAENPRKLVVLSRFAAISVSLTLNVSLLQGSSTRT